MTDATWNVATDDNAPQNQNDEWGTEVDAEVQLSFETIGDGFTATFLEMDPRNSSGIVQAHFENAETLDHEHIGNAFTNVGRDLETKLKKVPHHRQVRIEWISNLDTGQASPMRVYKVQWR